jgi:hypothetical protein
MGLRQLARAASTLVVAMVVALAIPVTQLRLVDIVKHCCCPDPDNCHCPPQKPDDSGQPAMRVCHDTSHAVISPEAPGFVAPLVAVVAPPARIAVAAPLALPTPHASPAPRRPDAPS